VVFEALRFAALFHATSGAGHDQVLDHIAITKLLPKVHGSRQRLQPVLESLIAFAEGGITDAQTPQTSDRLPRSAEKLRRMRTTLLDAQFVSFAE
jgi:5-methylcytosine-specific restriction protein B